MKLIKWILLLSILVIGVDPFGVGFYLQNQYTQALERLNHAAAGKMIFKGNFVRGYLSSTATTEITFPGTNEPNQSLGLVHKIHQGPILLDFDSLFEISSYKFKGFALAEVDTTIMGEFSKELNKIYGPQPAYSITTNVDFLGSAVTKIINNPVTVDLAGAKLNWKGFELTVSNTRNFTTMNATLLAPSLNISQVDQTGQEYGTFTITNLRFDMKIDFIEMLNNANLTIDSVVSTQADITVLSLEKFVINGSEQTNNGLTTAEVKYSFSNLVMADVDQESTNQIQQDTYGPFDLTIKFANVDRQILLGTSSNSAAKTMSADQAMTTDQLAKLFANKPTLDVTLNLTTSFGELKLSTNALANPVTTPNPDAAAIMSSVQSTTNFAIAANLLEHVLTTWGNNQINMAASRYALLHSKDNSPNPYNLTPEQISQNVYTWVSKVTDYLELEKFLIKQDDMLTASIIYKDNSVTINELPRSAEDMQQLQQQLVVPVPGETTTTPATPSTATSPDVATPTDTTGDTTIPVAPDSTTDGATQNDAATSGEQTTNVAPDSVTPEDATNAETDSTPATTPDDVTNQNTGNVPTPDAAPSPITN